MVKRYLVAYRHYHAPDGCSIAYGGQSAPYENPEKICPNYADESVWATGRASGDRRLMGPAPADPAEEDKEPIYWYGDDGYFCTTRLWCSDVESALRFVAREFTPCKEWEPVLKDWLRAYWLEELTEVLDELPEEWRKFVESLADSKQ